MCTLEDEGDIVDYEEFPELNFIDELPVSHTYFNGNLRVHPGIGPLGSPTIRSSDNKKYIPVFSVVIKGKFGKTEERCLYAKLVEEQWDADRPCIVCLCGGPAKSKENAVLNLFALFTFSVCAGSEIAVFMYHSAELYSRHPRPSMAFLREVSSHWTIPVKALAMVTPGHTALSLGVLRFFAMFGFQSTPMLPFISEHEFGNWLLRQEFRKMSDEEFAAAVSELAPKLDKIACGNKELVLTHEAAEDICQNLWKLSPCQRRKTSFRTNLVANVGNTRTSNAEVNGQRRNPLSELVVATGKAFRRLSTIREYSDTM